MSADELNATRRLLADSLDAWGKDWLLDGALVRCRACRFAQVVEQAADPFPHAADCVNVGDSTSHPFQQLRAALEPLAELQA